jgi:hypothetical protein
MGLAVGIGLIATFSVLAFQAEQVGNTPVMKIVWVEKSTTQCDDPWYHEQISVIDFFANRKINVYDMDQAYFLEADHRVCARQLNPLICQRCKSTALPNQIERFFPGFIARDLQG